MTTTHPPPAYQRQMKRDGKLPVSTKFFQAIGGMPDGFKGWAFNTFLLIYYNQILGLPASWVSLALTASIVIDAIVDPMVGSFSDGFRSRWGRRHPLMFAAILPLGACLYLVFCPPAGISHLLLIAWLGVFTILTRVAMTFYLIPWTAMFAELSDDYAERSEILTWRYLVGGIGAITFTFCVLTFIFPTTAAFSPGQLNPAGYQPLAAVLSASVMATAFLTTWLTLGEARFLRQPTEARSFGLGRTLSDMGEALANADFRLLFVGLLIAAALTGTLASLEIYMATYFWGFKSEDLRWYALAGVGGLVAFAVIPSLQRGFDKKDLLLWCMVINLIDSFMIIGLRFCHVLPENGDPLLLQVLVANEVFRAFIGIIVVVMFISMTADTMDAQELITGKRQEGVFSAAIAFSNKLISGFGVLAAGLILDRFVHFPEHAKPGMVAPDVILRLGFAVVDVALLYLVPFYLTTRYRISRARHGDIQDALSLRNRALIEETHEAP